MATTKVTYISPAMPPLGIKVGIIYTATQGIDENEFIVEEIKFSKNIFNQMFKEISPIIPTTPEVKPVIPTIPVINEPKPIEQPVNK